MKRYLALTFLMFAFTFVAVENASACSCAPPVLGETNKQRVDRAKADATAVFVGRVVKILKARDSRGVPLSKQYISVFEVRDQWKGISKKQLRVSFFTGCCVCDFIFVKNKQYLVYAYGSGKTFSSTYCSRTKEITDPLYKVDLEYLGQPNATHINN